MTFEGVVAKGVNDKLTKMPIMFKIKSKAWLDKLKEYCKDDERLFEKTIMKKITKNLWATLNVMDGGGHINFDGRSLTLLHLI